MLRFQATPDRIFIEILKAGMEIVIDEISDLIDYSANAKEAKYELTGILPLAAKVFSPEAAERTLRDMLERLLSPGLYQLNEYHYLLLYDTLRLYAGLHNDIVRTSGSKNERDAAAKIGPFQIIRIDFDRLTEVFFYDTYFLLDPEAMLRLGEEEKKSLTLPPETFAVIQGFAPHPEEMALKELSGQTYEVPEESWFFGPDSKVYPNGLGFSS